MAAVWSLDIISAGISALKPKLHVVSFPSLGRVTFAVIPPYSIPDEAHLLRRILFSWPRPDRRRTVTGKVGRARRMDAANSMPMDPLPSTWREGGNMLRGGIEFTAIVRKTSI